MEIKACNINEDSPNLPNSPPDRISSIETTNVKNVNAILSSQNGINQQSYINTQNLPKDLSNETLQKIISNPDFYNTLCILFQARKNSLQNVGQHLFHQTQQSSASSMNNKTQKSTATNNLLDSRKANDTLIPSSPVDYINGSPAPSGRKSPSIVTSTSVKNNNVKQNQTIERDQKNSKMKKIKHKNLLSNTNIRSSNAHAQKIIYTPTYIQIANNSNEMMSSGSLIIHPLDKISSSSHKFFQNGADSSTENFDFIEAHKRLEIFENRIISGKSKYIHPACSVRLEQEETEKAEAENRSIVLTEEEVSLSQQYEYENGDYDELENHKIPLFWEKRSWDRPEDLMDESESETLKTILNDFNESFFLNRNLSNRPRSKNGFRYHKNIMGNSNADEYSDDAYDEYNSDDSNAFSSDDSDDDKSGNYHYHISTLHNDSIFKKYNRKKIQRAQSSPLYLNTNIHSRSNDDKRMLTLDKLQKEILNTESTGNKSNFGSDKNSRSSNKKRQTYYGLYQKKSSRARLTMALSNNFKTQKANTNSTTLRLTNLFYETDDSCDETDGELF